MFRAQASISQPGGLERIGAKPGRRWEQGTQALPKGLSFRVGVNGFLPLPILCILERSAGAL